uniref:Uncharacterized protein n=1 Tax=Anguilla anguilla TaxID=7936 RepID=A0A0E9QZJ9_ANGAN
MCVCVYVYMCVRVGVSVRMYLCVCMHACVHTNFNVLLHSFFINTRNTERINLVFKE